VCCPERRGRYDGVTFSHHQQIFIAGDEIVNVRCPQRRQQSAQYGLIIHIAQVRFCNRKRLDDFGLYRKRIDKILKLRCCQAVTLSQAGQHAPQFVQDVNRKQHVNRTVAEAAMILPGTLAG